MLEVRELFRTKKLGLQLGWDEEHDRAVVEKAPESRPWLLGLKLASVGERAVAPIETKRAWRALLESLAPPARVVVASSSEERGRSTRRASRVAPSPDIRAPPQVYEY